MYISNLQVSKAKYEASKLMKKHENNDEGVPLKAFNGIPPASTKINNKQAMATEIILKPSNHPVAHYLTSNAYMIPSKQLGAGKAQVTTTSVLDIKASNMQFSREQIKEIFQYHDSDNDGFLNLREVTKAFAFLGTILPLYKAYHGMTDYDFQLTIQRITG
ncbi:hypothetical protein Csa_018526 [Cucumis sativus]|nr:hypothetical protein Csa_018526 [Cucumis sativus]